MPVHSPPVLTRKTKPSSSASWFRLASGSTSLSQTQNARLPGERRRVAQRPRQRGPGNAETPDFTAPRIHASLLGRHEAAGEPGALHALPGLPVVCPEPALIQGDCRPARNSGRQSGPVRGAEQRAFELGFDMQPNYTFEFSVAAYYRDLRDLTVMRVVRAQPAYLSYTNQGQAVCKGIEAVVLKKLSDYWSTPMPATRYHSPRGVSRWQTGSTGRQAAATSWSTTAGTSWTCWLAPLSTDAAG